MRGNQTQVGISQQDEPMKRSEKLFRKSSRAGWTSVILCMAGIAMGCWAPVPALSGDDMPAGVAIAVGAGVLAVAALVCAASFAMESLRLARMAWTETKWEWERSVRPRI